VLRTLLISSISNINLLKYSFTSFNLSFPSISSYSIFETVEDLNIDYYVLLDFSRAEAFHSLLEFTKKTNKPLVVCSTGFTQEDSDLIDEKSKSLKLFGAESLSFRIKLITLKACFPQIHPYYNINMV